MDEASIRWGNVKNAFIHCPRSESKYSRGDGFVMIIVISVTGCRISCSRSRGGKFGAFCFPFASSNDSPPPPSRNLTPPPSSSRASFRPRLGCLLPQPPFEQRGRGVKLLTYLFLACSYMICFVAILHLQVSAERMKSNRC